MNQNLTKKQKEIFDFIKSFINSEDYSPSYREIAKHFGLTSTATIAEYISILEDKGYLTKEALCARSLRINQIEDDVEFTIPLLGLIAAGSPITAIRTHETIDIPRDMLGRRTFALKVRGESMIGDGIFDGDYVIIEPTILPRNGDIVVALIDKESATLKRFYEDRGKIRLQPANAKLKPIFVAMNRLTIQGKVKGVIRKY